MASGLNKLEQIELDETAPIRLNFYEKLQSINTGMSSSPYESSALTTSENEKQKQFYVGSDDEDDQSPINTSTSPVSGDHLSFADLMAHQNQETYSPASDRKRMVGHSPSEKSGLDVSEFYDPPLHNAPSLDQEMEKVFDGEGHTSAKPYELKMDFSNPALASTSSGYLQVKYGENDFESHRRSNVQMSKPMATHLSARDMKTIESVQKIGSKEKSKKRQKPNIPSTTSGDKIVLENRAKKKGKKKKVKRKSLTSKLREQPSSIPEEDERESDEDSEDEETDDESKLVGEDIDLELQNEDTNTSCCVQVSAAATDKITFVEESDRQHFDDSKDIYSVGVDKVSVPSAHVPEDRELDEILRKSGEEEIATETDDDGSCISDEDEEFDQIEYKSKETDDGSLKKQKKHRHRHKKIKGVSIQRRMSGIKLKEVEEQKSKILIDEEGLEMADIDEINRHRFDQSFGLRKHLLHRPVKMKKMRTKIAERKVHDHKPHEIFVELDELAEGEWKETARWIKFEEDVEESEMWGKPRVASLSFHSLLELRRTIEKGAIMLDSEATNLNEIADSVIDELLKTDQICADDRGHILRALLSKHKHHILETGLQYNLSRANIGNFFTSSSHAKLNAVGVTDIDSEKPLLHRGYDDIETGVAKGSRLSTSSTIPHVPSSAGPTAKDIKIMKKIPEGAEAAAVLVGKMDCLKQPAMAFIRLSEGRDLDNLVALPIPVRFVFVLLGPNKKDYDYHEIGRSISTLMADKEFRIMAYSAETRKHLLRAINEFLDDSIVLPPGQLENPDLLKNISKYQDVLAQRKKRKDLEEKRKREKKEEEALQTDDDPLNRTKRCFGGLIRDVKRRYPLYWSDIKDAFNLQCLASIIFIYFAALSPAITFGGLMGEKTDNWIGVSEMILGCCIGGCAFGLFSGQPLLIVGSTGPLIVFEEAVFNFCRDSQLPYLASRFWIGLWIFIIAVLVVAFEGSFLVRYITRFTQEIFSVLISLIFIYETFNKLAKTFIAHPLLESYPVNETAYSSLYNCSFGNSSSGSGNMTVKNLSEIQQPNTALLSTLLMFGTFIIAYFLRQFKNSKFFRSSVRRTIGDFGVPIAIAVMLVVDITIKDVYTQKLNVPQGISPTNSTKRGWLINPLGLQDDKIPVYMIFAASIPAFLVFILIFMESHITEVIVSAKERKLKKGSGFHLNLLVLGVLNLVLSTLGMPWVCCAAVRSITHTNSLTIMSTKLAPGEKPQIVGVREQRVTVFVVNAFLGLSILMQPLLKEIPLAVLFGIFLYMGVTSLSGVQFVDRIEMLFMPSKHYPDYSYVKAVRSLRIHIFTFIQTVCLVILWIVKSTAAQIAFPFALVLTIPLRFFALPRIFNRKEINQLDSDDTEPSVSSVDLDEYNDAHMPD